ncbi:hypothetical protein NKH10_25830 [Mesorhizobium sp. M1340]|uniref:hypothetical protein n=1 Tax=unclassified Mesorhizobium TaxID=325217 RepID=UPI00333787E8
MHTALEGSPVTKRVAINECIARERSTPLNERKTYAAIMNVSVARYDSAFCNRLFNALANGRLTYSDYRRLSSPGADSSKLIKILQGRWQSCRPAAASRCRCVSHDRRFTSGRCKVP